MKSTKKYLLGLLVFVCVVNMQSQNEFSKWYFGHYAGLDFSTSPPTPFTNGIINTGAGCATISDNAGNLLFYTEGTGIINSTHAIMANGLGLGFGTNNPGGQGVLITKQPGNTNLYYVFTCPGTGNLNVPYGYNIVDMSLAAGLGSVTVKNYSLYIPTCDKQVAVRHCNGKDIWILSHEYQSDKFRAYLLTSAGLSASPVISAVGEIITLPGIAAAGEMKISPDGKKLAVATASSSTPPTNSLGGFFLFDFDAATGVVSNSLSLLAYSSITGFCYGVEFSPDGSKFYGTTVTSSNPAVSRVNQWNVCAPSHSAILASIYSFSVQNTINSGFGSAQKGIDGKIYIACSGQQSLSVINNPNLSGAAMYFVYNSQSIAPKLSGVFLPNYINPYLKPIPSPFTNTINCQMTSFAVPPVPSFSSGCTSTPYAPNGYFWDFGDPGSGAANTSTLTNPNHAYSTTGTFTASLILINPCVNDTIKKIITISTPGPTPAIAGPLNICKGDKATYTVSGGSSYTWFNNTSASTLTLSPTTNTVYSVSATINGCTLSKTFSVSVNPCTDINSLTKGVYLKVFPNPFSNFIKLETSQNCNLLIIDINGQQVLESKLLAGENEINTETLKAGVYSLHINGLNGAAYSRLVKME